MKTDSLTGLIFAVIAAVMIVAAWVVLKINLAGIDEGSEKITMWGAYGDYFGGLLNPVFAFASFLLLILTIIIQTKELKASRKELEQSTEALVAQKEIARAQVVHFETQAKKEDLFRMINHVFNETNIIFELPLTIKFIKPNGLDSRLIQNSAKQLLGDKKLPHLIGVLDKRDDEVKHNLLQQFYPHGKLLHELKDYLEKYEKLSGNDRTVTGYYIRRYDSIVHDMYLYDCTDDATYDFYTRDYSPF